MSKKVLLKMLDTLGIKHFFRTLPCEDFKTNWKQLKNRRNPTWVSNSRRAKTNPNLTLIQTPDGTWHLLAQVSLPKMLRGHNAKLPNQAEVERGLKMISEFVEAKSGLPFDIETATVYSVHNAYDVHLSESEVLPTISKLADKRMKYMDKLLYNDSTLYFQTKNKSRVIRIYSKFLEVISRKNSTAEEIEAARGVLRFEYCLTKPGVFKTFIKRHSLADKTPLSLLNEDVSQLAIWDVFESLNFFELLDNDKSNLEILLEHYLASKAMTLVGFLEMVRQYGDNFYKNESLGFSKDCYYNYSRKCRDAKVWKRKSLE